MALLRGGKTSPNQIVYISNWAFPNSEIQSMCHKGDSLAGFEGGRSHVAKKGVWPLRPKIGPWQTANKQKEASFTVQRN